MEKENLKCPAMKYLKNLKSNHMFDNENLP